MRCPVSFSVVIFVVLLLQNVNHRVAEARVIEDWPLDKLKQSADLICIGKVVAIEEEKNERVELGLERRLRARIEIESVLKPQLILELKTISLVHYAPEILEPGEFRAVVNGPQYLNLVVSTKPGDRAETAENPKTQYYLMYLRRRDDGAFEPVSGHLDPDFSVWKLGRAR